MRVCDRTCACVYDVVCVPSPEPVPVPAPVPSLVVGATVVIGVDVVAAGVDVLLTYIHICNTMNAHDVNRTHFIVCVYVCM